MSKRILFVTDPSRPDGYNYLKSYPEIDPLLLWYPNSGNKKHNDEWFTGEFFWDDYSMPKKIISNIKPEAIVFMEMIDLKQIPLIITANYHNIPTIYLEHGAAGDWESLQKEWNDQNKNYLKEAPHKKVKASAFKTMWFYYSCFFKTGSLKSLRAYISLPFTLKKNIPNFALQQHIFTERVPKKMIVFNRSVYKQVKLFTGIEEKDCEFTGVPFFDKYYRANPLNEGHYVFIDHPYLEDNYLNWNKAHHQKIAMALNEMAVRRKKKLYVKLHPRSDKKMWETYGLSNEHIVLIQNERDYTDLFLSAKLILGFSSSLMVAFLCAKKNVVILGWHPEPQIHGADFTIHGVCHKSLSVSDLNNLFDEWDNTNKCIDNETGYARFLNEFNEPFDGRAGKRVVNAILNA